jgi:hypothetical protein
VGVGGVVIRIDMEIWEIGKGGTKRGSRKRGEKRKRWGKLYEGCWALWPLCVFGYISVVVVVGFVSGIAGGSGCVQLVQ